MWYFWNFEHAWIVYCNISRPWHILQFWQKGVLWPSDLISFRADVRPWCYTLCNPIPELQPLLPFAPFPFPKSLASFLSLFLFPILTLPLWSVFRTLYARPWPSSPFLPVFPAHPDQRYRNPISDLLIPPLLHSHPCTVLSSYKSELPMYSRVSLNIN